MGHEDLQAPLPHTGCFKQQSTVSKEKRRQQPVRFKTSLPQGGGILCQKKKAQNPGVLGLSPSQNPGLLLAPSPDRGTLGILGAFYRVPPKVSNFNEEIFHLPFCFQETSLEGIFTSH